MIKVFDDFLSEDIQKEVYELLLRPKWHLKGGTSDNPFWHMDNLEEEDYFNTFLFEKIKEALDFKDEEVSRVIQYKPNRALVFPAKIMHYADAPSRFYNGLRISLAYKLKV